MRGVNQTLEWRTKRWSESKTTTSQSDASKHLTSMKKTETFKWLNEVSSVPLQQTLRHQDRAFTSFFSKKSGYPKFKSQHSRQSFTLTRYGFTIHENGDVTIAKSKTPLDIRGSRKLPSEPSSATISMDRAGRFHISFLCEEEIEPLPKSKKTIALDLGVKDFAVTSDGDRIQAPKFGAKSQARIARLQRNLSKKEKGSKNREKARLKLAKATTKVADQRRDFLHKLSTRLVRENQTIILEDLAVKSMAVKSSGRSKTGMNRAIQDSALAEFRGMVAYKADWYGRELVIIDQWFPSTQLCSTCGSKTVPKGVRELGVREWVCLVLGERSI